MTNSLHISHRIKNHFHDQEIGELLFSRRIKNHSYDQEKEMLSITFQNGATQDYCKVPGNVYQELESSLDQNEYYDENIYGNYQLGRLDWFDSNKSIRPKVFQN
jgi:hypothetical protein